VLRIAHRGYAAIGPANRLATIDRAVALGCDLVEIDVRRRADGVLVLDHDDAQHPDAPTLAEALALLAPTTVGANLDLKQAALGQAVINAVTDAGLLGRVTCTGTDWPMLAQIHRQQPAIRVGLTIPRRSFGLPLAIRSRLVRPARHRLVRDAPRLLRGYGVDLLTVHHHLLDERVVAAVHAAGGDVWCWTVDDPAELARLRRIGVDGVCSDAPASHGLG
jgi:glycerophosphoryl diester phosphodiesterase